MIVVESGDGQSQKIAEKLAAIGFDAQLVAGLDEACQRLHEPSSSGQVLLIPSSLSAERIMRVLKKQTPRGVRTLSFGDPPDLKWRKRLRSAGVTLALWEPYDDAMLRCQLGRATGSARFATKRVEARSPTQLLARVLSAGRLKEGLVSSLSPAGAFVQTPRPNVEGATINLQLRLPAGPVLLRAEVVFANVPGNLQRPNLSPGMGLRFADLDPRDETHLRYYVEERLSHFAI